MRKFCARILCRYFLSVDFLFVAPTNVFIEKSKNKFHLNFTEEIFSVFPSFVENFNSGALLLCHCSDTLQQVVNIKHVAIKVT